MIFKTMWILCCSLTFHPLGIFWDTWLNELLHWKLHTGDFKILLSFLIHLLVGIGTKEIFLLVPLLSHFLRCRDGLVFSFNPYVIIHYHNYSFWSQLNIMSIWKCIVRAHTKERSVTTLNWDKFQKNIMKAFSRTITKRSNFYLACDKTLIRYIKRQNMGLGVFGEKLTLKEKINIESNLHHKRIKNSCREIYIRFLRLK